MSGRRFVYYLAFIILVIVLATLPSNKAQSENGIAAPTADWTSWGASVPLHIQNNAASVLPGGYTVSLVLDTASLVGQGQMLSDCTDLRISYEHASVDTELDRLVDQCNNTSTTVQFQTQADIPASGLDTEYWLHYDNPSAGAAPANPGNVYAFYDDFQDGNANGWNDVKGSWSVQSETGNYFYRYTGGGATWALSYLPLPGVSDLDYRAKIRGTDSPNTNWIGLAFRIQDQNNFMSFYQSRDTNIFKLADIVAEQHEPILATSGYVMAPNTWHWLRIQAVGNTVRGRIWSASTAEPTTWQINHMVSTFQDRTDIGATLYYHNTNADWDDFQVRKLVEPEPTVTPQWEAPWWDNDWGYRRPITVTNTSSTDALSIDYSIQLSLDTATLIGNGQMLSNCDDLRVISASGGMSTEIDRVVENCDTADTRVWFPLQRPIAASGEDAGYYVYYGNPTAGAPPADGMVVFLFFEDWEQGVSHWTNAGGLDTGNTGTMGSTLISTDEWVSPGSSQEFPLKAGGGDAFSGFIPVSPSTRYAIGVWGLSPSSTNWGPVGFDWYTGSQVYGAEVWLWTSEWGINATWSHRENSFTTTSTSGYLKIKSELWTSSPGTPPIYLDNFYLRYDVASQPTSALGDEQTILALPSITDIQDNSPINLGDTVQVTAVITTSDGTIDTVTLQLLSPETVDEPMSLVSGTNTHGTWSGGYTPNQGGNYQYRVRAEASTGRTRLSEQHTFQVVDAEAPQITLDSIIDPLTVRDTQSITVTVTDNGAVSEVVLDVEGTEHPMVGHGDLYDVNWQVNSVGTITYTVTATDTVGNASAYIDSFESLAREVDVCTWYGCKSGAASFSMDDGNSGCYAELNAAGFQGTYFYNGASTQSWFSTYSTVGHEIASHTVGHPCNAPCCSPNCTPESLAECPYTQTDVDNYRQNQLDANIQVIEAATGVPVLSLAWPCGCTDPGRMEAASYYYLGARGYYDYIAELTWLQDVNEPTPVNFMNLNSANSYNQSFIDTAINEGKWAIITSHGSCAGIDYMGSHADDLYLAPVGEVLKYINVRDAAQFSNYIREPLTISFDAAHSLSTFTRQTFGGVGLLPIQFDNPVTLKVHLLETDIVEDVEVDGAPVSYEVLSMEGTRYVTFDASLDASRHVVVNLGEPAPTIGDVTDNSPVEIGSTAQITATVTNPGGTVASVTLRLESPLSADYSMSLVGGTTDTYTGTFIPDQLGAHNYRVRATNGNSVPSESPLYTLDVVDTTPPEWRYQAQQFDVIQPGDAIQLSAEGMDLGHLDRAILMTDESGAWQEFDYPIADWWDFAWDQRRPVTVTEDTGLDRSNEIIDLQISSDQFSGLTSCVDELRVADSDRVEIPVQVYDEHDVAGVLHCNLIFQASVGASSSRTYYIYYDNPAATPPVYTTDLTHSSSLGLTTVANSFFNLDLDEDGGVVSRVRLPQGGNANLPLSPELDSYWGWHQVCSDIHGNITGKNNLCQGGSAAASGLSLSTVINGPLMVEFAFTNTPGVDTYTMVYRFFANAPYYEYELSHTSATALVMNNFWYANGNFSRLGAGSGGAPSTVYNTYDFGIDHIRIASFDPVDYASIDGMNNDGTDLGALDYRFPLATTLDLRVTTAASQAGTEGVLARIDSPLTAELGEIEAKPTGQYGSPFQLNGAAGWNPTGFNWQNPAIPNCSEVQWRVKYCDLSDNCGMTDVMSFYVISATPPDPVYVNDSWSGLAVCTDPDGAGPATSIGHDAFSTIQYGVNRVSTGGTVNVEGGSYSGSVELDKDATLTFNGSINLDGSLNILDGSVTAPSDTLSISGDFVLMPPGLFEHNGGTVVFNGTSAQLLGGSLGTFFNNLTISNAAGLSLSQDEQINGDITLSEGLLSLGDYSLTLDTSTSALGSFDASTMIVADGAGQLCKLFDTDGSFTYPIGDNTGTAEYSPSQVSLSGGPYNPAGRVCVNLRDDKHPQNIGQIHITRYWTVESSDLPAFSADVTFEYVEADVVGLENILNTFKYDQGAIPEWAQGNAVDDDNNLLSMDDITSFSDFTGSNSPTAVTLSSYTATPGIGNILIEWQTLIELDLIGFNLYRSESLDGERIALNDELIPARGIGEPLGASYAFLDLGVQAGDTYYYWLESVGISGSTPLGDPLSITSPYFVFLPVSIK